MLCIINNINNISKRWKTNKNLLKSIATVERPFMSRHRKKNSCGRHDIAFSWAIRMSSKVNLREKISRSSLFSSEIHIYIIDINNTCFHYFLQGQLAWRALFLERAHWNHLERIHLVAGRSSVTETHYKLSKLRVEKNRNWNAGQNLPKSDRNWR